MVDTNKVISDAIEGDFMEVFFGIADQQLGIFLIAVLSLSFLGSIAIYSRSLAVPATLSVLLLPIFGGIIGGFIGQIIAQFGIVVLIYMIYRFMTNR
jgi:hypothetical protein